MIDYFPMNTFLNKIFRYFYPAKTPLELMHEYEIPSKFNFQFTLNKDSWIVATSEDLPGFITEGRDPAELLEMINDAILTYYDVPRRAGDVMYEAMDLQGIGTITLNLDHAKKVA